MARKVRVKVGDKEVDAMDMDFTVRHEEWNEYELADGGRLRVRTTVATILRVLDDNGKPAFDEAGDPVFAVRHNTQVVAKP